MNFKSISIVTFIIFQFSFGQTEQIDIEENSTGKSLQGAFGAVTIDGKLWNQIALRPIIPFGKLSVALDLVLYIQHDRNP